LVLNLIKEFNFLKFSEDCKTVSLIFCESTKIFNLINVPHKIVKEALMNVLKIKENMIQRLYKQSLYWTIVCDDKNTNNKLDETMRNIKFEDNNPLRYEFTLISEIKNLHTGDRKDSRGWKGSIGANNESLSWRKKSDLSSSSKDE